MLSLSTFLKSGLTPTLRDFKNFLFFLSRNQRFQCIIHLFRQLSSNNIEVDAQTQAVFTEALLKNPLFFNTQKGRINEALEIFDDFRRTSNRPAASYRPIIIGLCDKGMLDMAIDVLIEYMKKGMPLDRKVHTMLIEAALNRNNTDIVLEMISRMEDIGIQELQIVCNDAISLLCKMGYPEVSYNILMTMRNKELAWESMGYYSILRALLFEGKTLWAQLILASFIKIYGMSDLGVCEIVVNFLCLEKVKKALIFLSIMNEKKWSFTVPISTLMTLTKDGRILDAYELMVGAESNLPHMNVIDYSIMIDALCKAMHINRALDLCALAKKKGLALNAVIYNSVINGLCRQGSLFEAFRLFDSLEKIDVVPTEVTYGTLIDALVKEGLLHDAKILFERMVLKDLTPNTHIYNSLIDGYCKANLLEDAMKLFQDLELQSLKPDGFTVGALINGYCQKGDMEGALQFFFEFKSLGLSPDFLGYMYLLRGLCAKGRLEESRSILREMLQVQSIVDLLGRIDNEVESDSVEKLLVCLCEQGRIHDALALLEEVGSMLFPSRSISSQHMLNQHEPIAKTQVVPLNYAAADFLSLPSDDKKVDGVLNICSSEPGKIEQIKDFDSFYSRIHSLCLKGELSKANSLIKFLIKS